MEDATNTILLIDASNLILIIVIIVVSGAQGGIASYFLSESEDKSLLKFIILGIVAAFIVPVFLNMISSNLLIEAQQEIDKIFVLAGYCTLAAVFSNHFLENIYKKILQQVG